MKKVVVLIVLYSGMIWGQIDYSKYDWKKGKEEVKKTEMLKLLEENKDSLVYETILYGYDTKKTYVFMFDTLKIINFDIDYKNIKKFKHEERKKLIENVIKEYGMFDMDSEVPFYLTDEKIWELGTDGTEKKRTNNEKLEYLRFYKWEKENYGVILEFMKYKRIMKNYRQIYIYPLKEKDKHEYAH